jgi:hypothetical protein
VERHGIADGVVVVGHGTTLGAVAIVSLEWGAGKKRVRARIVVINPKIKDFHRK